MEEIFKDLNNKQIEAVKIIDGPVLVISGPGSGKTRCLTHRAAYLISQNIPPENILCITFTNKAAGEMRERIINLLDNRGNRGLTSIIPFPLIGTFHSIGLRILRSEIAQLGYRRNFTVFDEDDQLALVKRVMGDSSIDPKSFNPKIILAKISELKTKLVFPEDYEPKDFYPEIVAKVYRKYQQELKDHNAVDFDDLIVLPIKIFRQNPETLSKYQEWWKYILVDEYQDTSYDQYVFINLLAQKYRNLFAIGDDAQCLPPGTKITTEKGVKNIEKVKMGDKIISPAGLNQTFTSEVTAFKEFHYDGPMIEIRTKNNHVLRATPNHILFGKLLPSKKFFITYLMYSKEVGYRVGITVGERHPRNGKKALGLRVRANQEKSDKIWILKLSSNRADAQFWEAYYAFKYGIPTTVFFADRGKGSTPIVLTQGHIDKLFKTIPSAERAANLMREEYLFPEYPHHRPQGTIRYNTRRITVNLSYFSTQPSLRVNSLFRGARVSINNSDKELQKLLINAGLKIRNGKSGTWRMETSLRDNGDAEILAEKISSLSDTEISKRALITNLLFDFLPASQIHPHMTVPVFDGQKIINDQVVGVKRLNYSGPVYDLNIKKTHTYIANGFAVHNSIYQFRRADIRNILNYQKDYPKAKIILLEQNYRSTKNIITAAQQIISNNKNQIPKELWTDNNPGEKITIAETMNERHEANFVISKLEDLSSQGYKIKDFAVLYRTHAQSRSLEEALIIRGFPYQIVGGLKFYDRKEIKDMLAYLRLIINPSDTLAIERIYNIPPRGIGKAIIDKVRKGERDDIIASLAVAIKDKTMSPRQLLAVSSFHEVLADIKKVSEEKKLASLIKYIIKKMKYEDYLKEFSLAKQNDYENFEDRLENLKELMAVASKFEDLPGKEGAEKFLEEVALLQQNDRIKSSSEDSAAGKITLMTIHASKGLEFPVIFIVGMEEGLFPHSRTIINPSELEEERRLCYVATTRAKEHLILTYTKFRNIFGSHSMNLPSRFIGEIPPSLVDYQLLETSYDDDDKIFY